MLSAKLLGWKASSYEIYCQAYQKFGGSVCNHPSVLKLLEEKSPSKIRFYHKEINGEIVGPIFTDNHGNLSHPYKKIPIIFENIILPICPQKGGRYLPAKSKELSFKHKKQFFNLTYGILNRRSICIVKESFSKKTQKKRQAEMRRFLANGGSIVPVTDFSSDELSKIYLKLMNIRWKDKYKDNCVKELADFIEAIRPMIFGSVLMFNDTPCAYDLVYKAECSDWIYFDDHNGGVDTNIKEFSPGSLLLSCNISDARTLCQTKSKECIFSLGRSNDKWSYKKLWAHEVKLGKSIF
ncbi:transcriptional regulator [Hafnia paralvei]|uniref:transcriptional regulator n=1 Tax=Hafnia paralvei TaxID=546367 RepID=UPI001034C38A|nr:transcriptional regulator [Hafnia paralvei]TBM14323.1 transcriptional regulator [Hafnia paralvei]